MHLDSHFQINNSGEHMPSHDMDEMITQEKDRQGTISFFFHLENLIFYFKKLSWSTQAKAVYVFFFLLSIFLFFPLRRRAEDQFDYSPPFQFYTDTHFFLNKLSQCLICCWIKYVNQMTLRYRHKNIPHYLQFRIKSYFQWHIIDKTIICLGILAT